MTTTFPTRGRRTIGVQVLDDSGAAAFASWNVNVTRAGIDTRPPLSTFRLNTTSFGGAAKRALVITYRLREKARVEVKLRRGAGSGQARAADRARRAHGQPLPPHPRAAVAPEAGRYVVRIFVQAASGKRQVAQLSARRR